jgi:hypothetical protein
MQFSVGKPNPHGYGLTMYQVSRQGNQISVMPPDTGRRSFRDGFSMSVEPDQIQLVTPERQFRIKMNSEGVTVDNPRMDGLRGGGLDMLLQTPLKPEQYESTGLSVAFSLIGLPVPPHLLQPGA